MSQSDETTPTTQAISDDQLPDDLNPEENPMAAGLDDLETVDDLLTGGKEAEVGGDAAPDSDSATDRSQDGDHGAS